MSDILKAATPRPWEHGEYSQVQSQGVNKWQDNIPVKGFALAGTKEAKANAQLIVKAVNGYEPMLEALKRIATEGNHGELCQNIAIAALAKARADQ